MRSTKLQARHQTDNILKNPDLMSGYEKYANATASLILRPIGVEIDYLWKLCKNWLAQPNLSDSDHRLLIQTSNNIDRYIWEYIDLKIEIINGKVVDEEVLFELEFSRDKFLGSTGFPTLEHEEYRKATGYLHKVANFICDDIINEKNLGLILLRHSHKDLLINNISENIVFYLKNFCQSEVQKTDFINNLLSNIGNYTVSIVNSPQSTDGIANAPNKETFDNRPKGESAPDFIKRVYGGWLTGEFTRADLRKIDPRAEMALRNWERSHGRAPLNLPTKKELNDKRLAEPDNAVSKHEKLDRQRLRAARRQNAKRQLTP